MNAYNTLMIAWLGMVQVAADFAARTCLMASFWEVPRD